jgi:hypothetical protein
LLKQPPEMDKFSEFLCCCYICYSPLFNLSSLIPWAIIIFFCHANLYTTGTIFFCAWPSSQWSCQKLVSFPFSTVTLVQAIKSAASVALCGMFICAHNFFLSFRLYHCQRRHKALLNLVRSSIPRPPSALGCCTLCQLMWQCPPHVASAPS